MVGSPHLAMPPPPTSHGSGPHHACVPVGFVCVTTQLLSYCVFVGSGLQVFRQAASHLPHEGNVEQVFSRAGNLSDPNMATDTLATLTSAAINGASYRPPVAAILDKYFKLFRAQHDKEAAEKEKEEEESRQSA